MALLGLSTQDHLCFIFEFCSRGSLFDIIHDKVGARFKYFPINNQDKVIEASHVRDFCRDVCQGMHYLHAKNIIHRDLKSANRMYPCLLFLAHVTLPFLTFSVLVDEHWTIKVSDFGLSKEREDWERLKTMTACGTPQFAAPEVLKFQKCVFT